MTENLPGYVLTIGVGLAVLLLTYRVVVRIMTSHAHRVVKGLVAVLAAAVGVFGAVFLAFWTRALTTKTFWMA